MKTSRTKRLTQNRVLKILQLRFGTQVEQVMKDKNLYKVNSICGIERIFTRTDILKIEDELYSNLGY